MHALILGGAGFVGLHLADRLVADGHTVTIVDDFSRGRDDERIDALRAHSAVDVRSADLTTAEAWARLPKGYDQIYLLAAVVGVRNVEADPARVIRVNTLTALHLLDWVIPGERIFFSSTSEVYAGGVDAGIVPVPTAEDVPVMVADVTAPRFAYAISKLLGEAAFVHGARAKGCTAVVGRFHNVYGPRMGMDHVIPEMSLRALRGENPFRVWGAEQYRAFCHVDDAVEAMLRLMACPQAAGEIVHIGNDSAETNIGELAELVLRVGRGQHDDRTAAGTARLGDSAQPRPGQAAPADRLRTHRAVDRRGTPHLPVVPRLVGPGRNRAMQRGRRRRAGGRGERSTAAGTPGQSGPLSERSDQTTMATSLKKRLFDTLDERVDRRFVAGLGSVFLSARSQSRCRVRYAEGHWVHRYPTGVVVNTTLGGPSARAQDQATQDVFLFDYQPQPGDTIFDIGAGVGSEVRLFSRLVGPAGRVVSVEAHPRTFACLRRTVELNQLPNVTTLECAVVGDPGPVYLEDDRVDHIRNGLTEDPTGGVEVAGRTLGEIMLSLGVDRIDLLKMNIEGAELPVLEKSFDQLAMVENLVVSCHDFLAEGPHADGTDREWQRTFARVTDLLRAAGYTIRTRPQDTRPWVRYYVYASRPSRDRRR